MFVETYEVGNIIPGQKFYQGIFQVLAAVTHTSSGHMRYLLRTLHHPRCNNLLIKEGYKVEYVDPDFKVSTDTIILNAYWVPAKDWHPIIETNKAAKALLKR